MKWENGGKVSIFTCEELVGKKIGRWGRKETRKFRAVEPALVACGERCLGIRLKLWSLHILGNYLPLPFLPQTRSRSAQWMQRTNKQTNGLTDMKGSQMKMKSAYEPLRPFVRPSVRMFNLFNRRANLKQIWRGDSQNTSSSSGYTSITGSIGPGSRIRLLPPPFQFFVHLHTSYWRKCPTVYFLT